MWVLFSDFWRKIDFLVLAKIRKMVNFCIFAKIENRQKNRRKSAKKAGSAGFFTLRDFEGQISRVHLLEKS